MCQGTPGQARETYQTIEHNLLLAQKLINSFYGYERVNISLSLFIVLSYAIALYNHSLFSSGIFNENFCSKVDV